MLVGLDAEPWSTLSAAYGPAGDVPDLVRRAAAADEAALNELWGTVWHQGTVYDCTPTVVPYLVRVLTEPTATDTTRSQMAFLLAAIAAPTSFVLPENPNESYPPAWLRDTGASTPTRDVAAESWSAVAASTARIAAAMNEAGPATRAGIVAVLAAVAAALTTVDLAALDHVANDGLLNVAVRLTHHLAEGTVTEHDIDIASGLDDEAADYLTSISDWPTQVRAAELVRELCERTASSPAD